MSQKAARRAVRALSVQEKLQAIDRVHNGQSKAAVAREIGVPESTLRGWCKGEEKLRGAVARQESSSPLSDLALQSDGPLDFSRDRSRESTPPTTNLQQPQPESIYPVADEIKKEALMYWMQQGQAALPISPLEARTADNTADTASWFWKWYKSYGVLPQPPTATQTNLSDEDDDPPATTADALYHGEKFLRWLECCSDPSVTALQILQFRYLLKNVKECAERRRQGRVTKARRRK